jgi:hypothetical protein
MKDATSSKRRQVGTIEPQIPDEVLRDFILSSEANLGARGTFRDGYVTAGLPDTCPYTDSQLGFSPEKRGNGSIESIREYLDAWHEVGAENREVLALYYWYPSRVTLERIKGDVELPPETARLLKSGTADKDTLCGMVGVLSWLERSGKHPTLRAAERRVYAAHVVFAECLANVPDRSIVRWKTGVL